MILTVKRAAKAAAAVAIPATLMIAGAGAAIASPAGAARHVSQLTVRQVLFGMKLHHKYIPAGGTTPKTEPLTGPDDITNIATTLFVGFQNGVGSQGEPSSDGNTDSTIVEFGLGGQMMKQWDVKGKVDGLTADPQAGFVIATVNEDGSSSLYTVAPNGSSANAIQHYTYNKPLPHFGGTDAISVDNGQILVSASAPGTTGGMPPPQPTYPAVYKVSLDSSTHVATVTPLFFDEATATVANAGSMQGKKVKLGLTDPDSNAVVPSFAPRFGGQFELTSQADKEQIFAKQGKTAASLNLHVLTLSQSVDDTAWAFGAPEILFATDATADTVDTVTGDFSHNAILTAVTPCDAANAPATCPAPGFPPNYLGSLNPWTGHISRVKLAGPNLQPKGLTFVAQP
jgi:hypothetical protein